MRPSRWGSTPMGLVFLYEEQKIPDSHLQDKEGNFGKI